MVLRIAFCAAALFLSACKSAPSVTNTAIKEPVDGKQLYEANCAACHLATGEGGISGAKDLRITQLNSDQIKTMIKNGKNGMMPFGDMLTSEEITAVGAYVQTLSKH